MKPILLTFLALTLAAGYLPVSGQTCDTVREGAVLHITDHYPNGQIKMTETYKNGRRDGDFIGILSQREDIRQSEICKR